jgi:hypothetical protein
MMHRTLTLPSLAFLLFFATPLAVRAAIYWHTGAGRDWWSADRSSAGLLPAPADPEASLVRVYCARTVRWRGIFAVHCWLVLKERGGGYERYDLTAWGDPIRINGFAADGRWFGQTPELVYAANGDVASRLIPRMRKAIEDYPHQNPGDYVAWPGPNSNTFVAAVLASVPEAQIVLPPTAVGKDYPLDGSWIGLTPSRTGLRMSLAGYAGLTVAWVEGVEVNILGGVLGFDLRRPAIKIPGFGRIGVPVQPVPEPL